MSPATGIGYLKQGSRSQQQAWAILSELKVFHLLREYSPTLAGTVPLDLDLPGSDLDILCCTKNLDKFEEEVVQQFGKQAQFTISQKSIRGRLSVVARFDTESWPIEIFS